MPVSPHQWICDLAEYQVTSQEVWHVPDSSQHLKLDWNESSHCSEIVCQALVKFLQRPGAINWYPDVSARRLTTQISTFTGAKPRQILPFGGSDVALETLVRAYVGSDHHVAVVAPGYDNMRLYADACGATVHAIHVGADGKFSLDSFRHGLDVMPQPRLIYVINPNNPIGYRISISDIETLLRSFPNTVVVVDEAYVEFVGEHASACRLVDQYDNLFVARSFSKAFGLAGLRLGYLVSAAGNIAHLNKIRNGKNVSMLAQVAGVALLERTDVLEEHVAAVVQAREWFVDAFRSRGGCAWESEANFVVVRVGDPAAVLRALSASRIYLRDRSSVPGMAGCLRITVGYRADMERVLAELVALPAELWQLDRPASTLRSDTTAANAGGLSSIAMSATPRAATG
ncbi:MAG: histidinol-phosphate aminotransferase family protein [Myxococcales bacterium FL481]|nr:MAG: histidinol-phosphate aminotransferase family protein [Myxococcales bacterium FL481]